MTIGALSTLLIFSTAAAGIIILISENWRGTLAALSIQYLLQFLILLAVLPPEQAAVKLVSGWMTVSIISVSMINAPQREIPTGSQMGGKIPRISLFLIGCAAVIQSSPGLEEILNSGSSFLVVFALITALTGLLMVGYSSKVLKTTAGVLTLLIGFEALYAVMVDSLLVLGLLAAVHLIVGMVAVHLLQLKKDTREAAA